MQEDGSGGTGAIQTISGKTRHWTLPVLMHQITRSNLDPASFIHFLNRR